jgi:hypothetical protein
MSLVGLLVAILIIGLILWVISLLPLAPPIQRILQIVVVVFVLLWLISVFFGGVGPVLRVDD